MAWETEVAIDVGADAAAVRSVLTDFDAYPAWSPSLTAVRGTPELGERLGVRLSVGDAPALPFHPTVTVVDPETELRRESRPGPEDLFVAEQGFLVHAADDGVRFVRRGRLEAPGRTDDGEPRGEDPDRPPRGERRARPSRRAGSDGLTTRSAPGRNSCRREYDGSL